MRALDPSPPSRVPVAGVLENVRSLWNVGSIFRSADGAGVDRLFLCGFTGHPPRPEIHKTALGAEDAVAWEYWTRAHEACAWLREEGWQVLALDTGPDSVDLETVELRGPVAFVVGHEIEGVSPPTRAACEAVVHLPMHGIKDSLNVAVAFGIAAYALRRRLAAASRAGDAHPVETRPER